MPLSQALHSPQGAGSPLKLLEDKTLWTGRAALPTVNSSAARSVEVKCTVPV